MPHVERELLSPVETAPVFAPARIGGSRTAALVRAHAANDPGVADAEAIARPPASAEPAAPAAAVRRPWSAEVHRRASRLRSRIVGRAILAGIGAIAALVRRAHDAWRARRLAASICTSLDELDDRTLRDLGLHRSEVSSLAAELSGRAAMTRMNAMLALQGPIR